MGNSQFTHIVNKTVETYRSTRAFGGNITQLNNCAFLVVTGITKNGTRLSIMVKHHPKTEGKWKMYQMVNGVQCGKAQTLHEYNMWETIHPVYLSQKKQVSVALQVVKPKRA